VLDFTAAHMRSFGVACAAEFFNLQLVAGFFVDTDFVILHVADLVVLGCFARRTSALLVLTAQVNIGVFTSWHGRSRLNS